MSPSPQTEPGTYRLAQAEPQAGHAGQHAAPAESAAGANEANAHAAESAAYTLPHEIPNVATLVESLGIGPINHLLEKTTPGVAEEAHGEGRPHPAESFLINPAFSLLYVLLLVWFIRKGLRNPGVRRMSRMQNIVESLLGGLRDFYVGIMGHHGYQFAPFLASMFLFIWCNNVAVLVPGLKGADSSFRTTIALALITFIYARYHNIKALGFKGYVYHLMGSPEGTIMWIMMPLLFVLEVVGEFIKPLSLGLRLFGNILGEDKLLAVFLGLGMLISWLVFGKPDFWIGVPLHFPFFFLVVLLSTIQAVVFTTLAAIYIVMMMPHEDHHAHGHDREHPGDDVDEISPVGIVV